MIEKICDPIQQKVRTSCLLLRKLRFLLYLITGDLTSFPMIPSFTKCEFLFIYCLVHYRRMNQADKMYPLLYWVTYEKSSGIADLEPQAVSLKLLLIY